MNENVGSGVIKAVVNDLIHSGEKEIKKAKDRAESVAKAPAKKGSDKLMEKAKELIKDKAAEKAQSDAGRNASMAKGDGGTPVSADAERSAENAPRTAHEKNVERSKHVHHASYEDNAPEQAPASRARREDPSVSGSKKREKAVERDQEKARDTERAGNRAPGKEKMDREHLRTKEKETRHAQKKTRDGNHSPVKDGRTSRTVTRENPVKEKNLAKESIPDPRRMTAAPEAVARTDAIRIDFTQKEKEIGIRNPFGENREAPGRAVEKVQEKISRGNDAPGVDAFTNIRQSHMNPQQPDQDARLGRIDLRAAGLPQPDEGRHIAQGAEKPAAEDLKRAWMPSEADPGAGQQLSQVLHAGSGAVTQGQSVLGKETARHVGLEAGREAAAAAAAPATAGISEVVDKGAKAAMAVKTAAGIATKTMKNIPGTPGTVTAVLNAAEKKINGGKGRSDKGPSIKDAAESVKKTKAAIKAITK